MMFAKAVIALLASLTITANARDLFEVESQYLGDGSFQYTARTLSDPFVTAITLYQIGSLSFTNLVESTPPSHWTNVITTNWVSIAFDQNFTQPRLNEVALPARSAETHYRRETNAWVMIFGIEFDASYQGAVGFVRLDCLVPCSADDADGSDPTLISRFEAIKDVKIDALVQTNNQVHGVTFSWTEASTVDLEGSHDLTNWTHIARFFGDAPRTTWTTNSSLNTFGQFFRLSLVANRHITNAYVARASVPLASAAEIRVQNCRVVQGRFAADFSSEPNAIYQIDLCNARDESVETLQLLATNSVTTADFQMKNLPDSGYVRVKQVSP